MQYKPDTRRRAEAFYLGLEVLLQSLFLGESQQNTDSPFKVLGRLGWGSEGSSVVSERSRWGHHNLPELRSSLRAVPSPSLSVSPWVCCLAGAPFPPVCAWHLSL